MYINIEDKQSTGIEGFSFTQKAPIFTEHADKVFSVTLPSYTGLCTIQSPRYDGGDVDKSYFYIRDIDKLIELLQELKKHYQNKTL